MTTRASRLIKRGKEILASAKFSAKETSELAGVLGTEEYWGGSRKAARRHFAQALVDPTENAVAQASWIARHSSGFVVPEMAFNVPLAFEATALRALVEDEHGRALVNTKSWQQDEPFSARPAVVGAWTASVASGDHHLALEFIAAAQPSNPSNPRLLANEFYALASLNKVGEAADTLAELDRLASGSGWTRLEWDVLLEADRGLLAFRSGDPQRGSAHYRRAMDIAAAEGFLEHGAHAFLNFAMEQVRSDPRSDLSEAELDKAVQSAGPTTRGALASFAERIKALHRLNKSTR
ncbi:MAG: hypothetical protein SFU57_10415 [Gemmatimonadales bacterium]|nr:hypothetical protein [Gemmatimonadales bacterium]